MSVVILAVKIEKEELEGLGVWNIFKTHAIGFTFYFDKLSVEFLFN